MSLARWTSLRLYPISRTAAITRKTISDRVAHGLCIRAPFAQWHPYEIACPRVEQPLIGFPQPSGKKPQRNCDVHHAGRHPHNQAPQLLVFQRAQSPYGSVPDVSRIPKFCSTGEQRTQNAGVNCRSKDISNCGSVGHPLATAMQESPPEQQRRPKESNVLCRMHQLIVQSRLVQERDVPEPYADSVNDPCREWAGNSLPGSSYDRLLHCFPQL